MIGNDGSVTNEKKFWNVFGRLMGEKAKLLEEIFEDFYRNEFIEAKNTTSTHPLAAECILLLKKKGYQIALATNPLFPQVATKTRISWAGLAPEDFSLITTYENSSYSKPNLNYYKEVLMQIGKEPQECIMVGNDITEDMCAAHLGMDTYLLKDCLICPEEMDFSQFRQGDFSDLLEFIRICQI